MTATSSSTFLASDGAGYELNMGRWSRLLAEPFLDFMGATRGGRVLDAGCGTGHLASAVARRNPEAEVEGIDLSPVYIAHAARQHADARLRFRVCDVCAIDAPDGDYDQVLSLLVLHFVPRWPDAIREMRRVARPGARVGAAVWDARGGFVANRLFFDTAATLDSGAGERRAKNYTRPLTRPGELHAAWRAAGFLDVEETQLAIRMTFASFDDYWAPYLGNDGPGAEYVRGLTAPARERLRAAVQAAYLDGEDDGPRSYAALAWAVRGTAPAGA